MPLEPRCALDLHDTSDFHLVRPYRNESGIGWGIGDGRVTGEWLAVAAPRSEQPNRRGDGATLPNARGVTTTGDGVQVMFGLSARTVFVDRAARRSAGSGSWCSSRARTTGMRGSTTPDASRRG